jgi:hypothetical protein
MFHDGVGGFAQLFKSRKRNDDLAPYPLFDGSCRDTMEFYRTVFGGELTATKVKDSPAKDQMPPFQQDRVLNARLLSELEDRVRKTRRERRSYEPAEGAILWRVWGAKRQIWSSMDVPDKQRAPKRNP